MTGNDPMPTLSARRVAILSSLAAPLPPRPGPAPIDGITRLQKLLFLTFDRLPKISPAREITFDFSFRPEKYGPADLNVYPDLDFLVALGYIARTPSVATAESIVGMPVEADAKNVAEETDQELSYDYLMGDEDDVGDLSQAERQYQERFEISDAGQALLARLRSDVGAGGRVVETIYEAAAEVKKAYGRWPLPRLLRFIYTAYPQMTTSSEIKEQVLGRY